MRRQNARRICQLRGHSVRWPEGKAGMAAKLLAGMLGAHVACERCRQPLYRANPIRPLFDLIRDKIPFTNEARFLTPEDAALLNAAKRRDMALFYETEMPA